MYQLVPRIRAFAPAILAAALIACSNTGQRPAGSPVAPVDPGTVVLYYEAPVEMNIIVPQGSTGFAGSMGSVGGFIGGFVGSMLDSAVDAKRNESVRANVLDPQLHARGDEIARLGFRDAVYELTRSQLSSQAWSRGAQIERRADLGELRDVESVVRATGRRTVVVVHSQQNWIAGLSTLVVSTRLLVYRNDGRRVRFIGSESIGYQPSANRYGMRGKLPAQEMLVPLRLEYWLKDDAKALRAAFDRALQEMQVQFVEMERHMTKRLAKHERK